MKVILANSPQDARGVMQARIDQVSSVGCVQRCRIMYPPEGIGNGATSKIDRFLRVFSSNHTETRADFHSLWTFDRCQCFVKKSKIALA
jgi:hypothetical protein